MVLNRLEYALMNNPVRAALQRHVEGRILLDLGGSTPDANVLEIGCGSGVGIEIIRDLFGAAKIDGFDLDKRMIERARIRHSGINGIRLWEGDVVQITAPPATYDAVFDFGILHHVPNWRLAIQEVKRVLVPGGRFFVEEPMRWIVTNALSRRIFDHPLEDRFNFDELSQLFVENGFEMLGSKTFLRQFAWFVWEKPVNGGS